MICLLLLAYIIRTWALHQWVKYGQGLKVKAPNNQRTVSCLNILSLHAADYISQPTVVENFGSFDSSTSSLLSNLGNKIRASSGEDKETLFLFQCISVLIQRFNSVLLHDFFTKDGPD